MVATRDNNEGSSPRFLPERDVLRPRKARTRAFLLFRCRLPVDKTMSHALAAVEKRGVPFTDKPTAQPCCRDCENHQPNRQSASGPRYGRWTIECKRQAGTGLLIAAYRVKSHRSGDSACPMGEQEIGKDHPETMEPHPGSKRPARSVGMDQGNVDRRPPPGAGGTAGDSQH